MRLGEVFRKKEEDDVSLREEVAKAGETLKVLQQKLAELREKGTQMASTLEDSEAVLKSLQAHMESELALQVEYAMIQLSRTALLKQDWKWDVCYGNRMRSQTASCDLSCMQYVLLADLEISSRNTA